MILGRPNSSCARRKKEAGSPAMAMRSPGPSAMLEGAWAAEGSTVIAKGEPGMGWELHETASE